MESVARIRIRDPGRAFSGSGILDPGSPTHISESSVAIFWVKTKKYYHSLTIGSNCFRYLFKNKIIINFVKFVATTKGKTANFFSHSSFVVVVGSGIRDG
jgi:hypothetical protein